MQFDFNIFGLDFKMKEQNILATLFMLVMLVVSLCFVAAQLLVSFVILPFMVLPEVFPEYFVEGFYGYATSFFVGWFIYGLSNKLSNFHLKVKSSQ